MPINVDRFERMAGEVMKVYQDAEATMLKNISAKLYADPYTGRWAEKKYAEMRNVNKAMQSFVGKLHSDRTDLQEEIIRKAYSMSGQEFLKDGAQFAELAGIKSVTPNATKVVNIISDLSNRLDVADRHILRAANDAYADIVGRTAALMATGTVTVRDAVKRELEDFSAHGIASFTDSAGRHWDMETYAEMATLTAIERATIEGYTDAMEEFGFDLAEISSHYGACPICEAWEGVIVSVSGETHGYPSLDDAYNAGVFHPRCLHDISTYYEGISRGANRTTPRPVQDQPNFGYAARAQQRSYERMERQWKRRMAVAETPEEERKAYAHAKMYERRIDDLIRGYNLATGDEDYLYRKKYRMGPDVKLSPEAEKVKYALPESLRTYKVDIEKLKR